MLAAAARELSESGYSAFRIERVAEAAGVNRSTIYRRWPDKGALIDDTLRGLGPRPAPDEGSLRADIGTLLRSLAARAETPAFRGAVRLLTTEMGNAEVKPLLFAVRDWFQEPWLECLTRATARGELPHRLEPQLLLEVISGAIFFHLLRTEGTFDRLFAEQVIDLVLEGSGISPSRSAAETHCTAAASQDKTRPRP